jgi:ABC-2 type transport system permease protein
MTAFDLRAVRPARPAWWLLAAAEARLIARNRTVMLSATLMPVAFGLMLIVADVGPFSEVPGSLAAMQLTMLQAFGILMTVTMTLAARRQQLYLKRLRTSPASTAAIVAGITAPLVLVVLVQAVLVFAAAAAATDSAPVRPLRLRDQSRLPWCT